jgi:hypothetical protein
MQNVSNEAAADSIIVDRSLNSIKEAQGMLQNLHRAPATAEILASQIHLYDFLLSEISGIRNRLKKGVRARRPSFASRPPRRKAIEMLWPEHSQPQLGGMRLRNASSSHMQAIICAGRQRPC